VSSRTARTVRKTQRREEGRGGRGGRGGEKRREEKRREEKRREEKRREEKRRPKTEIQLTLICEHPHWRALHLPKFIKTCLCDLLSEYLQDLNEILNSKPEFTRLLKPVG
jgi:hypothetical protein